MSETPFSRDELIGLGESSMRKTYYAELRASLQELRRFRDLLDRSNDGVFLLASPGLELIDCNQVGAYLLGCDSEREKDAHALAAALEARELDALERFCARSRVDDSYTLVARFRRSSAHPITAELTFRRVQYGEEEFLVGTARDITERELLTRELRSSLREKDAMLREIHHRVGNSYQLITSLLALELEYAREAPGVPTPDNDSNSAGDSELLEFRLVRSAMDRVESIAAIHADLYRAESFDRVAMLPITQGLLHRVVAGRVSDSSGVSVSVTGAPVELDMSTAVPVTLLLNEFATNAVEHAFKRHGQLEIMVDWGYDDKELRLTFEDNGPGLPSFVELSEPTTLGLTLVKNLSEQANARVQYGFDNGACFIVRLPYRA